MANERRLISADEIEELFYKQVEYGATDLMAAFDDALQDCYPVNAVEVVRCKDCEYYYKYNCYAQNLINNKPYVPPLHMTGPDDYCSNGKRRDE